MSDETRSSDWTDDEASADGSPTAARGGPINYHNVAHPQTIMEIHPGC